MVDGCATPNNKAKSVARPGTDHEPPSHYINEANAFTFALLCLITARSHVCSNRVPSVPAQMLPFLLSNGSLAAAAAACCIRIMSLTLISFPFPGHVDTTRGGYKLSLVPRALSCPMGMPETCRHDSGAKNIETVSRYTGRPVHDSLRPSLLLLGGTIPGVDVIISI